MAVGETPHFSIVLQVDRAGKPHDQFLEVSYRLAGGPGGGLALQRHPALQGDGKPFGWWLYDEFDVLAQGSLSAFTHSILFTGGVELNLIFFGLTVRRLRNLLIPSSAVVEGAGGEMERLATSFS